MQSSRLHVVILSQIYPPDMAGSATRALNVAKGLIANNVRVTVVAGVPHYPDGKIPRRYRWKPLIIENQRGLRLIRTFVPPLPSKGFGRRLLLFVSFIASSLFAIPMVRSVDVVFASNPQTLVAYPASVFSKLHGCPLILNVDDLWPESLYDLGMLKSNVERRIGDLVARVAYSLPNGVTPISSGYVETLVQKYGVPPSKLKVVPGGVDLKMFEEETTPSHRDDFEILYIGAFSAAYDFDQVLRAAKLLENEPEIRFVFQGSGELVSNMKATAKTMNLTNVTIHDWVVPREVAARMMLAASVLVVPLAGTRNIERGFSSKIYEYQAAGKPIVCCSRGQAGTYVLESRSGMVVEPGDSETLAHTFMYLHRNMNEANSMGDAGRRQVASNYSAEAVGRMVVNLIGGLRARKEADH